MVVRMYQFGIYLCVCVKNALFLQIFVFLSSGMPVFVV